MPLTPPSTFAAVMPANPPPTTTTIVMLTRGGTSPRPLHADAGPEHVPEEVELGRAEPLAQRRRRANRAVIFDEQKAAAIALHLGHIAFVGAHARELLQLFRERRRRRDARRVFRRLP